VPRFPLYPIFPSTSTDIAVLSTLLVLGPQGVAELAAASAVSRAAKRVSEKVVGDPEHVMSVLRKAASRLVRIEVEKCSRLGIGGYSVPATEGAAEYARRRALEVSSEALEALKSGEWRRAARLLRREKVVEIEGEARSAASVLAGMISGSPFEGELRRAVNLLMRGVKTEEEVVGVVYTLSEHPLSESVKLFHKKHLDYLYSVATRHLEYTVLGAAIIRALAEVLVSSLETQLPSTLQPKRYSRGSDR